MEGCARGTIETADRVREEDMEPMQKPAMQGRRAIRTNPKLRDHAHWQVSAWYTPGTIGRCTHTGTHGHTHTRIVGMGQLCVCHGRTSYIFAPI